MLTSQDLVEKEFELKSLQTRIAEELKKINEIKLNEKIQSFTSKKTNLIKSIYDSVKELQELTEKSSSEFHDYMIKTIILITVEMIAHDRKRSEYFIDDLHPKFFNNFNRYVDSEDLFETPNFIKLKPFLVEELEKFKFSVTDYDANFYSEDDIKDDSEKNSEDEVNNCHLTRITIFVERK